MADGPLVIVRACPAQGNILKEMDVYDRFATAVEGAEERVTRGARISISMTVIAFVVMTSLIILLSAKAALIAFFSYCLIQSIWLIRLTRERKGYEKQLGILQKWLACEILADTATDIINSHDEEQYQELGMIFEYGALSARLSDLAETIPIEGPALKLYNHMIAYIHIAMRAPAMAHEDTTKEWMELILHDQLLAKLTEITLAQASYYNKEAGDGKLTLPPWDGDTSLHTYDDLFTPLSN